MNPLCLFHAHENDPCHVECQRGFSFPMETQTFHRWYLQRYADTDTFGNVPGQTQHFQRVRLDADILVPSFAQRLAERLGEFGEQLLEGFRSDLLLQLAFPYDKHFPALFLKQGQVSFVTFDVLLELHRPILEIRLGKRKIAVRTSMPEATVDEQCDFLPRPRNIRPPWNPPLKTITSKSSFSENLAHKEFGLGIRPFVSRHGLMNCRRYRTSVLFLGINHALSPELEGVYNSLVRPRVNIGKPTGFRNKAKAKLVDQTQCHQ